MTRFDVILGMDWLAFFHATVDYFRGRVTPSSLYGIREWSRGDYFLASLLAEEENVVGESYPAVVCDFLDVFPEDLTELPPYREVEFTIDLMPGEGRTSETSRVVITIACSTMEMGTDCDGFYDAETLGVLYVKEIVRLHGVPVTIVSDRDAKFTSKFWEGLQTAFGTVFGSTLNLSTTFHPQTDGHYQASIEMALFEALYGRPCRSPICWIEVGETAALGPDIVLETTEKIKLIRQRLLTAQSRQKNYADRRRRPLSFKVGYHVFLRVSPWKGLMRFGKNGKLSPQFIGPFEILDHVGEVTYRLALPPQMDKVHNVFHVSMLRKYEPDPSHILDWVDVDIDEDISYQEGLVQILDTQQKVLRVRKQTGRFIAQFPANDMSFTEGHVPRERLPTDM
ncbi:uncharacterized protein LOC132273386 [Cornus florida]|uniref:uncharacterized protein LOC132273386 n=1 Tax=Cornus florida TaxID=4283 RepID=UPI002897EB62|nr:uncharacterized protein LOC132273386 [Cornus florida]